VCGLLDEALDVLPATIVNRPAAMGSNFSKPAQAQASKVRPIASFSF